jgi:hypothetical protein
VLTGTSEEEDNFEFDLTYTHANWPGKSEDNVIPDGALSLHKEMGVEPINITLEDNQVDLI